jgi:hypothetical protein
MAENKGWATIKVFQMHSWCAALAQGRAKMSARDRFVTELSMFDGGGAGCEETSMSNLS